jgi:hypothetical protein
LLAFSKAAEGIFLPFLTLSDFRKAPGFLIASAIHFSLLIFFHLPFQKKTPTKVNRERIPESSERLSAYL